MASNASLEALVPELNPLHPKVINLGAAETYAVITPRVKRLLETPEVRRIGNIRQLGLINLVYPGATHSRLEHALGTYAQACEYIRALYYSRNDPMFRSIFGPAEFKAVLIAALLHDVGYYPLAHDLEDCKLWKRSGIGHESYSVRIIRSKLASMIEKDWDISVDGVVDVLSNVSQTFRAKILRSIISGPIDADKLDYLLRDSMHLGLAYGNVIDKRWLLRNLTIVYGNNVPSGLAVTDKGRVSAESIAFARYAMFTVAYWHHTVRAIKAMLGYAVGKISVKLDPDKHFDFFENMESVQLDTSCDPIASTDARQLVWIRDKVDESGKAMIDSLLERDLYKRVFVIDPSTEETKSWHRRFQKADNEFVENFRQRLEEHVKRVLPSQDLKASDPLPMVLVDVPKMEEVEELYYATEKRENLLSQSSIVWKELAVGFSQSIGKVRIFTHPTFEKAIKKSISREKWISLIGSSMEKQPIRQ